MVATLLMNYRKLAEGEIADQVIAANYTCPNDGFKYGWLDDTDPTIIFYLSACPIDPIVANIKAQIATYVTAAYNATSAQTNPVRRLRTIVSQVHTNIAAWVLLPQNVDVLYVDFLSVSVRLRDWIIAELKNQGILGP
jgi:hypothetical protein